MRAPRAAAVAFLLGFAMMALELTAVRLLAPYFGDSAYVWTNVIGVMLVALAAGAWLGGATAGRPDAQRWLGIALLCAAVLAALAPWCARPLGGWLVPQDLPLEAATAALVRGSLFATLVLFAPPVLLLGCAGPMLVAALAAQGVRVGRASGLISACSTLGSLAGTFAATHVLVPELGSRASVWLCAGAVALCAGLVWRRRAALAVLLPALCALLPAGPLRPPPPDLQLLAEEESALQFLQVVRQGAGGRATTMRKINEGLDSFHSLARAGSAWTGAYYDWHALAPILAADGAVPDGAGLRVLSLGSAAGTFARLFADAYPDCVVDGVELDPAVVALGERWFGGRAARGTDHAGLDARVFVARARAAAYDVVLVDTYIRQIYVPAHVASAEFFALTRRCLRPGGVVTVNAGGWSFDDPVVGALASTMAAVFGEAFAFRVPWSRNFLIVARNGAPLDPAVLGRADPTHGELAALVARAAEPLAWRRFAPDGCVLRDDRPLLDALQHRAMALARRGAEPGVVEARGDRDPDGVGVEAHALLQAGRPEAALDAIRAAREITPYLRLLAGDARWALHDVAGGRAEFAAALAAGPAPELREPLAARLRDTGEFLDALARAERIGARNGWLAAAAALAGAAAALVVWRRMAAA